MNTIIYEGQVWVIPFYERFVTVKVLGSPRIVDGEPKVLVAHEDLHFLIEYEYFTHTEARKL